MFCSAFCQPMPSPVPCVVQAAGIQFLQSWMSEFAFGAESLDLGMLYPLIPHSHLGFQQDLHLRSFLLFVLLLQCFLHP